MTFHATVVQVLLASPGDTQAERTAILAETSRWNGRHARGRGFVLSPWLYELHATPILGDRPQAIINGQGVSKADAVVAVFSARLGTDTGISLTGTEEEISEARAKGIPVHVYFSEADLPHDVDPEQLTKLREFKQSLRDQGLYATFSDPKDLSRQVIEALEYDLDAFEAVPAPQGPSGVDLRIEHLAEKEQTGLDKNNKMKYRHRVRDLVISNDGKVNAEGLQLQFPGLEDHSMHIDMDVDDNGWTLPKDLPGRSQFSFTCFPMARKMNLDLVARWTEDSEVRTQPFTVTVS